MQVVTSWSGGKDSCLACYKAKLNGLDISYLVNFINETGERSRSHGIRTELLQAQDSAIGIPLIQRRTTWETYELEFKKVINELKQSGIKGGVFGDIDIQEHRDWVERVCAEIGIKPILPLWGIRREKLLEDFINAGFKAIVVTTKADLLGEEWLGRAVDKTFVEDLKRQNIDLAGESGEYHTLVVGSPLFKKRIKILNTSKILRDKHWFLDILSYEIREK
jgi:uncharacterized protein (TIGR00290 family)